MRLVRILFIIANIFETVWKRKKIRTRRFHRGKVTNEFIYLLRTSLSHILCVKKREMLFTSCHFKNLNSLSALSITMLFEAQRVVYAHNNHSITNPSGTTAPFFTTTIPSFTVKSSLSELGRWLPPLMRTLFPIRAFLSIMALLMVQ